MKYILGIDPGFAKCGVAVVGLSRTKETVIELHVIVTKKSDKKRKVRASEDNVQRIREIASYLGTLVNVYDFIAICTESQSWPRNAGTCGKLGMAWGVVVTLATAHGLPVLQATPMELKKAVCGNKVANKSEVKGALVERYGKLDLPSPAGLHEHACDALGAVVACLDADAIQIARRMM